MDQGTGHLLGDKSLRRTLRFRWGAKTVFTTLTLRGYDSAITLNPKLLSFQGPTVLQSTLAYWYTVGLVAKRGADESKRNYEFSLACARIGLKSPIHATKRTSRFGGTVCDLACYSDPSDGMPARERKGMHTMPAAG